METVGLEKHELPPTNQKRMVAFINHFVLSTVNFLNKFAADCESKFVQYEHKMQNLEASLLIVEAKLASIDALNNGTTAVATTEEPVETTAPQEEMDQSQEEAPAQEAEQERDPRYESYFKMIQVGVPIQAVKNKISSEGLDPTYINAFL